MDAAILGSRNGLRLEFRTTGSPAANAGGLPRWQVRLTGTDLDAVLDDVGEGAWEPQSLAAFLGDLARNWRGWDGDRTWQSEEAELRLISRHDKPNTVLVRVELGAGAPPRWRCEADLELDPGVFQQLAEDIHAIGSQPLE